MQLGSLLDPSHSWCWFVGIQGRASTSQKMLHSTGNDIWTAHVGDSRAVLCSVASRSEGSTRWHPPPAASWSADPTRPPEFKAEALTKDHHPGLEGERTRIEAAGGFVSAMQGLCLIHSSAYSCWSKICCSRAASMRLLHRMFSASAICMSTASECHVWPVANQQ